MAITIPEPVIAVKRIKEFKKQAEIRHISLKEEALNGESLVS